MLERYLGKSADGRKELLREDAVREHDGEAGIDYTGCIRNQRGARKTFVRDVESVLTAAVGGEGKGKGKCKTAKGSGKGKAGSAKKAPAKKEVARALAVAGSGRIGPKERAVRLEVAPLPPTLRDQGAITRAQFLGTELRDYMQATARRNLPGLDGLTKARR